MAVTRSCVFVECISIRTAPSPSYRYRNVSPLCMWDVGLDAFPQQLYRQSYATTPSLIP